MGPAHPTTGRPEPRGCPPPQHTHLVPVVHVHQQPGLPRLLKPPVLALLGPAGEARTGRLSAGTRGAGGRLRRLAWGGPSPAGRRASRPRTFPARGRLRGPTPGTTCRRHTPAGPSARRPPPPPARAAKALALHRRRLTGAPGARISPPGRATRPRKGTRMRGQARGGWEPRPRGPRRPARPTQGPRTPGRSPLATQSLDWRGRGQRKWAAQGASAKRRWERRDGEGRWGPGGVR